MPDMTDHAVILGGGMTGLAAGLASGFTVFEGTDSPGGICSSYYVQPGNTERLHSRPPDEEAYRFEIGGGHWIFGGDPLVLSFIDALTPTKSYRRRSSVYIREMDLRVPYPIQNHLRFLGPELAAEALTEMAEAAAMAKGPVTTMAEWLRANFGNRLCALFFEPFHELYTAGLWRRIAPQDAYKSPVDLGHAIQGAFGDVNPVGYNATFVYPVEGLNAFAQRMAARCDIRYGKQVAKIDSRRRELHFGDGDVVRYQRLLSTLPLNRMVTLTGLEVDALPDPSPSVLVLNLGAARGPKCPDDHWVYVPESKSGFHRVGFYSNVDESFLPKSARARKDRVSIYVEKAYGEGHQPDAKAKAALAEAVVQELTDWGWIERAEVVDPTWIDVAYTWSWPGSRWRERALEALQRRQIHQVGRYARWVFQGIAESVHDGLVAGTALRHAAELGPAPARRPARSRAVVK